MKKKTIYIMIALAAYCLQGCSGFLDENPKDQMSEEEAFKSPALVYLNTVASLYTYVGNWDGNSGLGGGDRGIYDLNTFSSDEAILPTRGGDWDDGGLWRDLFTHNWGTNNALLRDSWNYIYKVIGIANQSISKLEGYIAENPEEDYFVAYHSEARAFRAMYYYYLLDMFARVPLVIDPDIQISDVAQSSRSEVFAFVVKELQESVENLNTTHSNLEGEYYGRMTQPVAYFLLAKLALNAEVYSSDSWWENNRTDGKNITFPGTNMNAWDATVFYCDKIAALGYDLENSYSNNFAIKNENSRENIYTIPMDPTLYKNRIYYLIRSRHYDHAGAYNLGGWNGASATKEAVTVFGYGTGNQDPRFDFNYHYGKVYGPNGEPIINSDAGVDLEYFPTQVKLSYSTSDTYLKTGGARMKKYEMDTNAQQEGVLQNNDYVLFRYADVLLMKAEAKVRNGGNGNNELNRVRNRVGAPEREATLQNILDERLLELAWEGWRRQDLIRFGLFNKAISDRPATESFKTVFAIDNSILNLNAKLTQNHGY
ncbi:RagB/SusD family nutrient uptake outer membrane protein [Parabacteroides sp. OttesenSCG-928-J18]|nr:RagB/SusD family nutrient uptake outer membrane protein [Parabacteroides sp. OttesenSCG-928-J18]